MYFVQNEDGNKIYFDAEEQYGSTCPGCGQEHMLVEDEFWQIAERGEVYGGSMYCVKCSVKLQTERKKNGIVEFSDI